MGCWLAPINDHRRPFDLDSPTPFFFSRFILLTQRLQPDFNRPSDSYSTTLVQMISNPISQLLVCLACVRTSSDTHSHRFNMTTTRHSCLPTTTSLPALALSQFLGAVFRRREPPPPRLQPTANHRSTRTGADSTQPSRGAS